MLFFLCCFRLPANVSNVNQLERYSHVYPIIALFFSGNNTKHDRLKNEWEDFIISKNKDENEILTSIDCSLFPSFCVKFLSEIENPKLILIINQKHYFADFQQNDNDSNSTEYSIKTVFDKLAKNIKFNFCPNFISDIVRYPAYVIRTRDYRNSCSYVYRYNSMFPHLNGHFYIRNSTHSSTISVYFNKRDKIDGRTTTDRYKLVKEYSFTPFRRWTIKELSEISRRLVCIVYSARKDNETVLINKYKKTADIFVRDFAFTQMTYDVFNTSFYAKFSEQETPFLMVSDKKKTRFLVLKNIFDEHDIYEELLLVRRGARDGNMPYTFEPLLRVEISQKREAKNIKAYAMTAFSVVCFTALVIIKRAALCINPHKHRSRLME